MQLLYVSLLNNNIWMQFCIKLDVLGCITVIYVIAIMCGV